MPGGEHRGVDVGEWCLKSTPRPLRHGLVALLTLAVVLAGCSSASSNSLPAPRGLPAFYAVPRPLPSAPGTLVKSQRMAVSGVHGTVYRVMYLSETVRGAPVAVTGIVVVPVGQPPAGGFPVVTWGHGTNGMADVCAPSLDPSSSVPLANVLLDRGWEIAASDYQGEGTPGLLPYLVGVSAARNTIDIVRAARHLAAAQASSRYVVWGHSEGGQTAMFALHIAAAYAPELQLQGVVAGAPPSQLGAIYLFLENSPFRYYLFMAAAGFHVAYGDKSAPLAAVLTPQAIRLLPLLDQGCSGYVANKLSGYSLSQLVKMDPFTVPAWRSLIAANDPESFSSASPTPLLMIQGGSDEQIPVVSTALLAQHLCGLGQDLERWVYPGQSHAGVIVPSMSDMVHWIADRFAGDPNPDPYQPSGLAGVQTTTCPS